MMIQTIQELRKKAEEAGLEEKYKHITNQTVKDTAYAAELMLSRCEFCGCFFSFQDEGTTIPDEQNGRVYDVCRRCLQDELST